MRLLRSSVLLAALAVAPLSLSEPASAALFVSVQIAPPVLPVYVQPPIPGPDYIWTPGYWAYADPAGYYWVPGTWVLAPQPGLLWTPAYWGWENNVYVFHAGYWGPHVGFYGGINYGFGYTGIGFVGGRWDGGHFAYNTAVNHVSFTNIHNTYVQNVTNVTVNHASFNGPGGVQARPTAAEEAVAHEQHVEPTALQTSHQQAAAANRAQFASVNHGRPAVAAAGRAGNLSGPGVVAARAAAPARAQAVGPHPTGPQGGPRPNPAAARPGPRPQAAHPPAQRPAAARPPAAPRPQAAPRPAPHPQGNREEEHRP